MLSFLVDPLTITFYTLVIQFNVNKEKEREEKERKIRKTKTFIFFLFHIKLNNTKRSKGGS